MSITYFICVLCRLEISFCPVWRYRPVPFGQFLVNFPYMPKFKCFFAFFLEFGHILVKTATFVQTKNNYKLDCPLDISANFHFNMSNISRYSSFFSKNILFLNIFWINLSLLSKITLSKRKGIKSQGIQCKKTAPSSGTVFISTLTFHHSRLFRHR